nr:hypothetical protein [Tanacetum cinerariifolium]
MVEKWRENRGWRENRDQLGTGKVNIQFHDGSSFILEDVRLSGYDDWIKKKNCVYTLEAKVMTFGVKKHGDSKQVGFRQLSVKQAGFKQLGPGVKTRVHRVQVDKRVWFKVKMQGAQGNHEAEIFRLVTMVLQWLKDG